MATSKPASKDHDKKAFGGKQAPAFGKGKAEQEKAKPGKGSKGRERQDTGKDTK